MCYTPAISLTTAFIEFLVAVFIFVLFRKSRINLFLSGFLILLGGYQFSEFMMCFFGNSFFWAKTGFVIYSFLPAFALYSVIRFVNRGIKSYKLIGVYLFPLFFGFYAVLNKNFVLGTSCGKFFIEVYSALSESFNLFLFYKLYYFGFIFIILLVLVISFLKEKNKHKKLIELLLLFSFLISLVSAVLLVLLVPEFYPSFPSVYCEFAVLFAVFAFLIAIIDSKREKGGKRK